MTNTNDFDVIIIGGSYSGLAAGMALGRALKKVLVIDNGNPCNSQTPYSHNFITNDGKPPKEIALIAKQQVQNYQTIHFFDGRATMAVKTDNGFKIQVQTGESFTASKVIFSTGVKDKLPDIDGLAACWGISVIHCPYCHGYEVRNQITGILGNGEQAYDFTRLIFNWANDLTLFTNGSTTLTAEQTARLEARNIKTIEKRIDRLEHANGQLQTIVFEDGSQFVLKVFYAPSTFEQHCQLPETLGCEFTEDGYIKVDPFQETTVNGVFACGDNVTRMRTVANAVSMGTIAGITASKKIILEEF